jgi:thymidylate synthase (FAD)
MSNNFEVLLDRYGSSPMPQTAIWRKQHICVSEASQYAKIPLESRCGEIIVEHQLSSKCPHVSVLDQAFVSFNVYGFPHSTMTQIRTHASSGLKVLAQSGRYTGNRFVKVANGELDVEAVIFFSPVGNYQDRQGRRYTYTREARDVDKLLALEACKRFASKVLDNSPYELAREGFVYEFRQDFGFAGTLRSVFHMLDYRSKKNSQWQVVRFAELVMNELDGYCPELAAWYRETRFGKAITGI